MIVNFRTAWLFPGLLFSANTHAALYGFEDEQGITHLANFKADSRYKAIESRSDFRAHESRDNVPDRYKTLIDSAAAASQLDTHLLHSIISVESGYNQQAVSSKGAIGLMQVLPATGRRFGILDLSDPQQNLIAGARYLRALMARFSGNLPLVIAAYNAGEGAVQKFGNAIPPYAETRDYVAKVLASYRNRDPHQDGKGNSGLAAAPPDREVLIFRGTQAVSVENW
jgi:soluble lytic murein transglycosylase-like protein